MTMLITHHKLDPEGVESSDPCHSRRPRTWGGASLHPRVADEQPGTLALRREFERLTLPLLQLVFGVRPPTHPISSP